MPPTPAATRIDQVPKEFHQTVWDKSLEDDCRQLVRLAVREDLDRQMDVTTMALIEPESQGRAVAGGTSERRDLRAAGRRTGSRRDGDHRRVDSARPGWRRRERGIRRRDTCPARPAIC